MNDDRDISNKDFLDVQQGEIKRVGKSGQISLGKRYAGKTFSVRHQPDGSLLLTSVAMVPESLLWTLREPHRSAIIKGMTWAESTPPADTDLDTIAADAKEKGKRGRKAASLLIFNYPIGPFTVWLGSLQEVNDGFGYTSDEVLGLFEHEHIDISRLRPDPRKYINDRLWRGRFGKNGNPAPVDADTATKVKGVVMENNAKNATAPQLRGRSRTRRSPGPDPSGLTPDCSGSGEVRQSRSGTLP